MEHIDSQILQLNEILTNLSHFSKFHEQNTAVTTNITAHRKSQSNTVVHKECMLLVTVKCIKSNKVHLK